MSLAEKKGFFEGWYFKVQKDAHTLAVIAGWHHQPSGGEQAFLQLIVDGQSYSFPYPSTCFSFLRHPFEIIVDQCIFTKKGMSLFLHEQELCVEGELRFGALLELDTTRWSPSIMGPFSYVPFMECRHEVISMGHRVTGQLWVNGKLLDFTGGTGYIEADSGCSFPSEWLWMQCNQFEPKAQLMLATATVPFLGLRFRGVICAFFYDGVQYRLATYNGARQTALLRSEQATEVTVANRRHRLVVRAQGEAGQPLLAPQNGSMVRIIREEARCSFSVALYERDRLIVEAAGKNGGFEYQEREQPEAALKPETLNNGQGSSAT